ncbi:MAG: hypothetical protein WBE80_08520 [Methylocella sp.]
MTCLKAWLNPDDSHAHLTGQPERGAAAIGKAFRAMPAIAEGHVEEAALACRASLVLPGRLARTAPRRNVAPIAMWCWLAVRRRRSPG